MLYQNSVFYVCYLMTLHHFFAVVCFYNIAKSDIRQHSVGNDHIRPAPADNFRFRLQEVRVYRREGKCHGDMG